MQMVFIEPGSLRTEVSLQAAAPTGDGMGGFTLDWTEVATVFARIEPISQASVFAADQRLETATHRIALRRREGVASGMRFVRQARIFEIVTVHDPDESGRYLVCRVREDGA